jgi:hypothetical protein
MSNTLTVRLTPVLARWLEETAESLGVSQSQIVRDQLEAAKRSGNERKFARLKGAVSLSRNLSSRKGYAQK